MRSPRMMRSFLRVTFCTDDCQTPVFYLYVLFGCDVVNIHQEFFNMGKAFSQLVNLKNEVENKFWLDIPLKTLGDSVSIIIYQIHFFPKNNKLIQEGK